MLFHLLINCDNAAFEGDATKEIARCLISTANKILAGDQLDTKRPVLDFNGNKVGFFTLENN